MTWTERDTFAVSSQKKAVRTIAEGKFRNEISVALIHATKQKKAKTGLAAMYIGGGIGCSTIINATGG